MKIKITVNGEQRAVEHKATISGVLEQFGIHQRMVVVEHNGDIVPRDKYGMVVVQTGDNLEIVQMMAGG